MPYAQIKSFCFIRIPEADEYTLMALKVEIGILQKRIENGISLPTFINV